MVDYKVSKWWQITENAYLFSDKIGLKILDGKKLFFF